MNILLTNDDGILADGIQAAAQILSELGNVTVVAPSHEQSAVSSKITVNQPLRVQKHEFSKKFEAYSVSGTPADCVKLAFAELNQEKFDLVVSGINHGSNTGLNIIYSGTVAGAVEGMLNGVPSIAISVASFTFRDFSLAGDILKKLIPQVLQNGLLPYTILNVNLPPVKKGEEAGVEFCHISENRYIEDFDKREDPIGRPYYWLGGKKLEIDKETTVDDVLVKKNYVTIAPVKFEFNCDQTIDHYKKWKL